MILFTQVLQGVVLGAVQGLAEFLPVSSSGHLLLVPVLFGWDDQGLSFDVVLHLGTLIAIFWCFWSDIIGLAKNALHPAAKKNEQLHARDVMVKIAVAATPALLIGYVLNSWLETHARNVQLVAFDLIVWGSLLWYADSRATSKENISLLEAKISWKQVLSIAFAQPLALLPGTSRSGITITAGLLSGMSRALAARFSFFVSIPVMVAAGGYGLLKLFLEGGIEHPLKLLSGFLTAAITGIFAIRLLLRYVVKESYVPFVIYRYALALTILFIA